MACNLSLLLSSLALLVVLIGITNSPSLVDCLQRLDILNATAGETMDAGRVDDILRVIENKDQVELGKYTVQEILAIKGRTVDACRSFNTSYHHAVLEYYSTNNGLFEFYRDHFYKLISWCLSQKDTYLGNIKSGMTDNEIKIFNLFTYKLPKKYLYMSEVSVDEAVQAYLTEARGNRTMNSQFERSLRAELESTCRHILKETDIFQEMRRTNSWYSTTFENDQLARFDKANIACKIYLEKLA